MRKTNKTTGGTSFFDTTISTTIHTLRKIMGKPLYISNDGEDKTNYEWAMEIDNGDVFTVYDWKEYKALDEHEIIEFHIGGHNKSVTIQARNEMYDAIKNIK